MDAGLEPLLEAHLRLQVPDLVFQPSLELGASDSLHELVEGLLRDVFKTSTLVPRLAEHSGFTDYQVLMPNSRLYQSF